MANILSNAESYLRMMRRKLISGLVTIRRGSSVTESVPATQGNTRVEASSADGLAVRSRVVDFLIERADYKIDSLEVKPEPGDEIVLTAGGETRVFQVAEIGAEPCWRWHDRAGNTCRIHTVQVGTE